MLDNVLNHQEAAKLEFSEQCGSLTTVFRDLRIRNLLGNPLFPPCPAAPRMKGSWCGPVGATWIPESWSSGRQVSERALPSGVRLCSGLWVGILFW